ncbi:MAG: hypothetical protein RIA64_01560 [Rhodospirillales bacterium]
MTTDIQAALERGHDLLAPLVAKANATGKPQHHRAPDGRILITVRPSRKDPGRQRRVQADALHDQLTDLGDAFSGKNIHDAPSWLIAQHERYVCRAKKFLHENRSTNRHDTH